MFSNAIPPTVHMSLVWCLLLPSCFALQTGNQTMLHAPSPSPNAGETNGKYEFNGPSKDNLTLSSADSTSSMGNEDSDVASSRDVVSTAAHFNPSTALVIVVLIGAFFSIGVLSMYVQRCTERSEMIDLPFRHLNFHRSGFLHSTLSFQSAVSQQDIGLSSQLVSDLPTWRFSKDQGQLQEPDAKTSRDFLAGCVVCLNAFEDGEELRLLPNCGHSFHQNCIDMWLFSQMTCPLCRSLIANKKEGNDFVCSSTNYNAMSTFNDTSIPIQALDMDLHESLNNIQAPR